MTFSKKYDIPLFILNVINYGFQGFYHTKFYGTASELLKWAQLTDKYWIPWGQYQIPRSMYTKTWKRMVYRLKSQLPDFNILDYGSVFSEAELIYLYNLRTSNHTDYDKIRGSLYHKAYKRKMKLAHERPRKAKRKLKKLNNKFSKIIKGLPYETPIDYIIYWSGDDGQSPYMVKADPLWELIQLSINDQINEEDEELDAAGKLANFILMQPHIETSLLVMCNDDSCKKNMDV